MKILLSAVFILLCGLAVSAQTDTVKKFVDDSEVPRININDAKKAFDDGSAVFIDARSVEAYKEEHIKGAIIIEGAKPDRFDSLPKGKKIIAYCS
ncbi:hypothetical protein BH10ACI2_BH10ACI2_08180 [soil metagenome]